MDYEIRSSTKSRHIRISVYPGGKVIVTKPIRVPLALAEQFLQAKSAWIEKKIQFQQNRKTLPLSNPVLSKSEALAIVKSRIEFYHQHYKFSFGRVSIKNHKTLWGSCSARKNLNFNYRITQLLPHQADYIIVHELCHLREMNHSRKFWDLVRETIPDYKSIRQELKSYSFY